MSKSFKESETLKNLMRAFAGESQARNRYTFAASLCQKQQLHVLEAVFTFTANQEKEHAEIVYTHMKEVAGGTVHIDGGYPVDLTNEFEEFDPVYPSFAQTARQEGFPQAAASFEQIAKIEKAHGNRFQRFAELLEGGKLFVSDANCGWLCLNCGHIHEGLQAPKACPVCSHDQGFFIRLEMAPYGGEILKG